MPDHTQQRPKRPSSVLARWLGGAAYHGAEEARATKELRREELMASCSAPATPQDSEQPQKK